MVSSSNHPVTSVFYEGPMSDLRIGSWCQMLGFCFQLVDHHFSIRMMHEMLAISHQFPIDYHRCSISNASYFEVARKRIGAIDFPFSDGAWYGQGAGCGLGNCSGHMCSSENRGRPIL
jgi:hypothetical protein